MGQDLFEVADSSDQHADELRLTLNRVKEAQTTNHALLTSTNERIYRLERKFNAFKEERDSLLEVKESKKNKYKAKLALIEKETHTQIDKLLVDLKDGCMNGFLSRDMGFDKAKAQVLCLHPDLDLFELKFFKEVKDGPTVDEVYPKSSKELVSFTASDDQRVAEGDGDEKVVTSDPVDRSF